MRLLASNGRLLCPAHRIVSTGARKYLFLYRVLVRKLALAGVLGTIPIRGPHLVGEGSSLTLGVLERAVSVCARSELAHDRGVVKVATLRLAIGAVAARGLRRVAEGAAWVLAVGEELAVLFALVGDLGRRGRVTPSTLVVLARYAKAACVVDVDAYAWGCSGRLMSKFAGAVGAGKVEATDSVFRVWSLAGSGFGITASRLVHGRI